MSQRHEAGLLVKLGLRLARIGQGRAGGNRIDANMLRRESLRESFGQCRQTGFGNRIAGKIRGQPVNALVGDIDDAGISHRPVLQRGLIGKVAKAPEGPEVEVELGEGMKVKVIRETISQVVTKSAPPEGSPPLAANEDNKGGGLLGGLFKR